MKTLIKTLFKLIALVILTTILVPVLYFAWRASQPMELPEFNGLTYYQFIDWRAMAYEDLASKYEAAHPEKEVKHWVCNQSALAVDHLGRLPFSAVYPLASTRPELRARLTPFDRAFVPDEPVTWWDFLPQWWVGYEKLLWNGVQHDPQGSVVYCRIQPDIPTPDEFQVMKQAHEFATAP